MFALLSTPSGSLLPGAGPKKCKHSGSILEIVVGDNHESQAWTRSDNSALTWRARQGARWAKAISAFITGPKGGPFVIRVTRRSQRPSGRRSIGGAPRPWPPDSPIIAGPSLNCFPSRPHLHPTSLPIAAVVRPNLLSWRPMSSPRFTVVLPCRAPAVAMWRNEVARSVL